MAWVNEWGVWAMSLICNPVLWQHQHTYGHHSFTNEFDNDPDLHHFHLLLRVHRKIRYEKIFRYQSNTLFVGFAYLFVVFGTCFWIPWGMISTGSLYGVVDWHDKDRPSKAIGMRLHIALYVFVVIVLPLFAHKSLLAAILAISLHISTMGVIFAIFSQVNHLNEPSLEADMETRTSESVFEKRDPRVADSWAAAQVETSNNFASQSLIWHCFSNGLNHQIEHHLFPGLNHGYLQHIAPVVRQTCEEYGVEYKSYDTWSDLMTATLNWYDKLSVDEYATAKQHND
jgi:fatty acid desaturase